MTTSKQPPAEANNVRPAKLMCGIVMPIASFDGCTEEHWLDVRDILEEAIVATDFSPNLVSNATEAGIIHKRIIENLYDNPVVVCDVSGRNPNVMFELGIRLAFDKPTIIVKDDKTPYSFDTSPIEHLEYPRDLRFSKIVDFKEELSEKIRRTHEKSEKDPNYTTFLKHFGTFKVAKLEKEEVSADAYVLDELRSLRLAVQQLSGATTSEEPPTNRPRRAPTLCFREVSPEIFDAAIIAVRATGLADETRVPKLAHSGHHHLVFPPDSISTTARKTILNAARKVTANSRWLS
jgi:hypothetical protein